VDCSDSNKIEVIERSKSESMNLFITPIVQVLCFLIDHVIERHKCIPV